MQVQEAIILAGGLGTRLREAVPDLPKCMAPVNNRPFIYYVITHLQKQGIQRFIFSLGYKSEAFTKYIAELLPDGNYELVIEKEPLGTGGAIKFACSHVQHTNVVVVNGDSIFKTNIAEQDTLHTIHNAHCTLALKPMENFERYGVVELNDDQSIASFKEKQYYAKGLINGGVYLINARLFLQENLPEKFSFETDYLQVFYNQRRIFGVIQEGYFIDIGIPEDYLRAQTELTD
jgi:D-glycero-alpha-D-manno-heptose 1-phosphate guanylyltransferase